MAYCAYCGAKMSETADSCPVCGRWKQQVTPPGGSGTVREPTPIEKTKVYTGDVSFSDGGFSPTDGDVSFSNAGFTFSDRNVSFTDDNFTFSERAVPTAPQPRQRQTQPPRAQSAAPQQRQRQPAPQRTSAPRSQPTLRSAPGQRPQQTRPAQQTRQPSPGTRQYGQAKPTSPTPAARRRTNVPQSKSVQIRHKLAAAADAARIRLQPALRRISVALGQIPRRRLYAAAGALTAVLLVIVLAASLSGSGSPKGVLKRLARAYHRQSAEAMMALGGDLMQALYPDAELEKECRANIDVVRDVFSDRLGSRYRFSYKISLGKSYEGDELKTRLENTYGDMGGAFDLSRIQAMASATLTLRARRGGAKAEKRIAVTLVKENGRWRLASQLV